jgi:hypothetical protein
MATSLTNPLSFGRQKSGRLGGRDAKKKHGRKHFVRIGRMGGKARKSPSAVR